MNEISKQNLEINRKIMKRQDAVDYFNSIGEKYKSEIISSIPEGEEVSLYEQETLLIYAEVRMYHLQERLKLLS